MRKLVILLSIIALTFTFSTSALAGDVNQGGIGNTQTGAGADANANLSYEDNRKYESSKRYFGPAGEIIYPGAPNILTGPQPSYMDKLNIDDILEYDKDGLTLNEALQMRQDETFMGKRIMVREKFGELQKSQRLDPNTPIGVVYEKQDDMQSVGTITVVSDSKKSISPDVFAEVLIRAHALGAVKVHVKGQGFQRLVRNEGAGIGFTWTGTTISGPQTSANTGVLGGGKSWGEAGYFDHPFIIVHALAPKNLKFTVIKKRGAGLLMLLKD